MFVVNHRKIFYWISGVLVAASIISLIVWGLNIGIDFKGGSLLEISYQDVRPDAQAIKNAIDPLNLGEYSVRTTGDKGYIIRAKTLTPGEKDNLVQVLDINNNKPQENRFDSIGPVLGAEAANKAFVSIFLVILCIVLYITFAFRKVSDPVSSWKYGLVAILALAHDVIIPTGVFSVLGHFAGFEVDTLFVTALLVILGFSVHDTIVVFDRVRENLKYSRKQDFAVTVGESINQTFTRSINTSLTVIIALLVLYFVAGETTQHFALTLLVGIVAGTYSSIFIGSPLLVTLEKWKNRKTSR